MQDGKVAVTLSVNEDVLKAAKTFVVMNKRKGRRNLSEFTSNLWIAYLRGQGVKLPPLFKS